MSRKASRKFAASGKLKKKIEARHKHQKIKKQIDGRKARKGGRVQAPGNKKQVEEEVDGDGGDGEEVDAPAPQRSAVDEFLEGKFMEEDGEEDDDDEDEDDNASFASVDDLEDEGTAHAIELSKLAENDPEFFKYLQENDEEVLEFAKEELGRASSSKGKKKAKQVDSDSDSDSEAKPASKSKPKKGKGKGKVASSEDEDEDMEDADSGDEERRPVLTNAELRGWQKALLEHRSLRALRKLLIAFRSAAYMNDEDQPDAHGWTIDSSSMYNKVVTTALKYTPVILAHHLPYKTLPTGKFKQPTQTTSSKSLSKLISSHTHSTIHLASQLSDPPLLALCVAESSKLIPYIVGNRKTVRAYLKWVLEVWSGRGKSRGKGGRRKKTRKDEDEEDSAGEDSEEEQDRIAEADDQVRVAALLAIRKLMGATDESLIDGVLKGTYLSLVRSTKSTTAHTLPIIYFLKNSAGEIYCLDSGTQAYQHAFGYIRQLAVHLRNSMKVKTKDAYKLVYNWQFAHCVDFWCIVLAQSCDAGAEEERGGKESELKPLIYPLVQVALGAVRLIPTSKYYPFHLHIMRSILRLIQRTRIYIPLTPYLLPILTASLTPSRSSSKPKSALRPLDLETTLRTPAQYLRTRIYAETCVEEAVYLIAEWCAAPCVQYSAAFPEAMVPAIVVLRKALKNPAAAGGGKSSGRSTAPLKGMAAVKTFIERLEESVKWVKGRRENLRFAPANMADVGKWEREMSEKGEAPLVKYVKTMRKTRERKKEMIEKARTGEHEVLET